MSDEKGKVKHEGQVGAKTGNKDFQLEESPHCKRDGNQAKGTKKDNNVTVEREEKPAKIEGEESSPQNSNGNVELVSQDQDIAKEKKNEDELRADKEKQLREQEEVQHSLNESKDQLKFKLALRHKNLEAGKGNRPPDSFFKNLDSSVKKNSAFIKKLRSITEQQRDTLAAEFAGLNLSRYVQEAVTAISDGLVKLKQADVSCVVHLCGLIHQRYAEFCEPLRKTLIKLFENYNGKDEEKVANVSRFRVILRLYGELILTGIFSNLSENIKTLTNLLAGIINCDKENHVYVQVLITFSRHCGEDFAGIVSRKQRLMFEKYSIVDYPRCEVIPVEAQKTIHKLVQEYYASLAKHLVRAHKDLQNRDRQNRHTLMTKGELHPERKEAYEKAQKAYDKLLNNTSTLADILDEDMPDLPQDEIIQQEESGISFDVFNPFRRTEDENGSGLWEDEDTRMFYENLKDLKAVIPGILYKDDSKVEEESKDEKFEEKDNGDTGSKDRTSDVLEGDLIDVDDDFDENHLFNDIDDTPASDSAGTSYGAAMEALIQKLPTCVNKDFIDEAATEFLTTCNTKGNRRKLCRALFMVPRIRLDLLPMYSRLVATLDPCVSDLAPELLKMLKGEFRYHVRKKDQINLESKVKTVRFIGELTKFQMFPKGETLHCLKMVLEDFTHHNIEMCCNLLEVCGRFLYRSPDSHVRTKNLLELMMRKKAVQNLDSRQLTMIDTAFYYCNPPDRQKVAQKERPPMHEYIRKLLYKDLSKTSTEKVLRQMRKLPWDDPEVALYAIKCLIRIWNVKFSNIHCVASLLAGMASYHEDVGLYVVDGLLEEIRVGMEFNLGKMNQRRLTCVKFLGEMYNYRLVEDDVIFNTLYSLITFGSSHKGTYFDLDPPEHLFRIRLVCSLLDTCGQYFDRGSAKRKLDCFLTYFQAYILRKKSDPVFTAKYPFPKDVDYMIADTMESLRPRLRLITSLEEAVDAAEKLSREQQEHIDKVAPANNLNSEEEEASASSQPIAIPTLGFGAPGSPSISLADSPSHSPMFREEDEHSGTGESDTEELEDGQQTGADADEYEVIQFDEDDDNDMNKVTVLSPPKPEPSVEDRAFLAAFDKLMVDDLQNRRGEKPKVPNMDIALPMNLKGQLARRKSLSEDDEPPNFVLMTRGKGSKQLFKDLQIPLSADRAANIREKQRAEQAEQEELKRLVLDFNQRQEEEVYNEMMAQQRQSGEVSSTRPHGRQRRRPHVTNDRLTSFPSASRRR